MLKHHDLANPHTFASFRKFIIFQNKNVFGFSKISPQNFLKVNLSFMSIRKILDALKASDDDINAPAGILRGVRGRTRGGRKLTSFKGIPYALPPTGSLRFARPRPFPEPGWRGVRLAYTEGPGERGIQIVDNLPFLLCGFGNKL